MFNFLKPLHQRHRQENPFYSSFDNFKKITLGGDKNLEWVEESFSATEKRVYGGAEREKPKYLGSVFTQQKLMGILFFIFLGLFLLLIRTAYLQAVKGSFYHQLAEGNRIRINYIKSSRGIIYTRNLAPLVKNTSTFSLYLSPIDLPRNEEQRQKILAEVAEITDISLDEINNKLKELPPYFFQPVVIKENIGYEEAIRLKIKSEGLPGVNLETTSRREYLADILSLSHIIGYEGKINNEELEYYPTYLFDDHLGKTGLELSYEKILRGEYGKEEIEVDALGKKKKLLAQQEQKPGNSLVLTIDLELQKYAEKILKQVLTVNGKHRGAVIALDPNNGEILALVSWPAFDNNLFAQGIKSEDYEKYAANKNKPLFNRAVAGEYPSGSTFKPIVAAAALQEGIITPNTSFNSVGGIQIDKWFFPDWKAGGHGWTNVIKALAESVNTFFYYIGGGDNKNMPYLGVDKIVKYAKMFGLSSETGVDLPNEQPGFLPTMKWKETAKNEQWYIGDTYHLAIGQGDILVTPLQVADYTATLANGGTYYKPHLVKEILNVKGEVVEDIDPKIINKDFIKKENIVIIKQGLRQAVVSGSAKALQELPFKAAGKTGTAEWGNNNTPHAWFTGFAPYDDPQLVVTVLIEEGGEGSIVALPVAKEIWQWWFSKQIANDK